MLLKLCQVMNGSYINFENNGVRMCVSVFLTYSDILRLSFSISPYFTRILTVYLPFFSGVCPVLCGGNGLYVRGLCQCFPGWKGSECLTEENECEDPSCHGNGKCIGGKCVCSPGFTGDDCGEGRSCDQGD